MNKRSFLKLVLPAALFTPTVVRSEQFLSSEQAQRVLFPNQNLKEAAITLTSEQRKAIQAASGVRVRSEKVNAWRTPDGGWFIVDNVLGKHEYIDFALALTAAGAVKGVEILVYRETYGGEIRHPKWLAQFRGKTTSAAVKVDADIKNISGATLSSVHIAEGVRRLLHTHALALTSAPR
jgi:Na+-translocating ferredoxin:NAD+ oxidoreductase RnfG subunit